MRKTRISAKIQPRAQGLRRNKLTILEVEAPGPQDTEAQEHQAYFELPQRSGTGWIGVQNVKLFLSEPLVPEWLIDEVRTL